MTKEYEDIKVSFASDNDPNVIYDVVFEYCEVFGKYNSWKVYYKDTPIRTISRSLDRKIQTYLDFINKVQTYRG